jgi:hydrogenase maturation protease
LTGRRAAIFIGNSIFGDDKIGLTVGETLRDRLQDNGFDVHVIERTGFALLDCLEGYDSAVVVDSVCNPKNPVGEVTSFSVDDFRLAKQTTPHYSGVPEAVKLMRDLEMNVPDISVIGINVRNPYALSDDIADDLGLMKDTISGQVYSSIVAWDGREGG